MFKKIVLSLVTIGTVTSSVAGISIANKFDSNRVSTMFYDNNYFTSKDKLLRYYLKKHPEAISTKTVIGDVNNSVIDVDDGILNPNTLYDYDLSKMMPIYKKSSGQETASFADALASYANIAFVREKYEGVENLYSNKEDAMAERSRLISNLYMNYLLMPSPMSHGESYKINPLNESDFKEYVRIFEKAMMSGEKINEKFIRKFSIPEKLFTGVKKFEKIENIEEHVIETISSNFEVDEEKEDKKRATFIVEKTHDSSNDKGGTSLEGVNISFFGDKNILLTNLDVPFEGNGLETGLTHRDAEFDMNDTGAFTQEIFGDQFNDASKLNNSNIFDDDSLSAIVDFKIGSTNWWKINFSQNPHWFSFAQRVNEKKKEISAMYGSNYGMEVSVSIKNNDYSHGSVFNGIKAYWNDRPGTTGENGMTINAIDLSYFEFKVQFKELANDESLLTSSHSLFQDFINELSWTGDKISQYNLHDLYTQLISKNIQGIKNSESVLGIDIVNEKKILEEIKNNRLIKESLLKCNESIYISGRNSEILFGRVERNSNNISIKLMNKDPKISKSVFNNVQKIDGSYISNVEEGLNYLNKIMDFITKPFNANKLTSDKELIRAFQFLSKTKLIFSTTLIEDENPLIDFDDIFNTHLQSLNRYLYKKYSDGKFGGSIDDFTNTFIKNASFDLSKITYLDHVSIPVYKGSYVLISESLYNAGLIDDGLGNIGPSNIFTGPNAIQDIENQRNLVINSTPPTVRVMYNINGEIIVGDISQGQLPIYDSEELLVSQAKYKATVRKNKDYIFYEDENSIYQKVLNHQANIYTLRYAGRIRYFQDHAHLKNYLLNRLMQEVLIIK